MSKFSPANVLCLVCLLAFATSAQAAEEAKLSGAILKLSEITDKPFTVNTGGLVVVIVRGAQYEKGQLLMGGGFTWHLFTPVTEGETTIKASYTENGDGGKKVVREYKVKVEKGK